MLRNLALSLCVEPFTILLDVDFVPVMPSDWVAPRVSAEPEALVLPAFELLAWPGAPPAAGVANLSLPGKHELRRLVRSGGATVPHSPVVRGVEAGRPPVSGVATHQ